MSSSSYVDATSGSVDHCHFMGKEYPELAEPYYDKIALYCQQKLWHQLTLLILDFMSTNNKSKTLKSLSKDPSEKNTFYALYVHVVQTVYKKLNPLAYAQITCYVAFLSLHSSVLSNITENEWNGSQFLIQEALKKVDGMDTNNAPSGTSNSTIVAAKLYLQSQQALLTLQLYPTQPLKQEQLTSIKTAMTTNENILKQQLIPDTPEAMVVHASHYEMSMTYYKLVGPPESFYDQAMLYLNYYTKANENDMEAIQKQHQLAIDLCLAALTGNGVYNLGQLVTNPIVSELQKTSSSTEDYSWLVELLQACSNGNVSEFKHVVNNKYPKQIASQPTLVHRQTAIHEKMTLLSLVQLVFDRPIL